MFHGSLKSFLRVFQRKGGLRVFQGNVKVVFRMFHG